MKEVIVHPTPTLHTTIHDVPIPTPGPDELVIKVIVAGTNPKGLCIYISPLFQTMLTERPDWDHPRSANISLNSGDDFAGVVHSIGTDLAKTNEFKVGDRVAAFHPMMSPHGAFAEYAVAPGSTAFKLAEGVSFEGMLGAVFILCFFLGIWCVSLSGGQVLHVRTLLFYGLSTENMKFSDWMNNSNGAL